MIPSERETKIREVQKDVKELRGILAEFGNGFNENDHRRLTAQLHEAERRLAEEQARNI